LIPFQELTQAVATRAGIDTVSFDVFDTVVFRIQGDWEGLLGELGSRLVESGLLAPEFDPTKFSKTRLAAERAAHAAPQADGSRALSLDRIYAHFPREHLGPNATPEALAQAEFDLELASAFALPATLTRIAEIVALGRRVCFTSNTYYHRHQLVAILEAAGVPSDSLQYVFCSCDYGRGKQHGLFEEVLRELVIAPENLIHCGDNRSTDVNAPAALGIETSLYRGSLDWWRTDRKHRVRPTVSDALRSCSRFDPTGQPFQDFGYTFLGPIIAGFVVWTLDLSLSENRPRLFFAEREGVFLREATELLRSIIADKRYDQLETYSIAVSRQAVMPLVVGSRGHLDLQTDLFERRLRLGSSDLQPHSDPAAAARAEEYLTRTLLHLPSSLFVDIGYKGTINHVLNARLGGDGIDGGMLGAYLIRSAKADAGPSPSRGYLPADGSASDVLAKSQRGISFLEQCLMPPTGSVIGYDADLSPIRERSVIPERQVVQQAAVQEGILAFVADLAEVVRRLDTPPARAAMSRAAAERELVSLFREPTPHVENLAINWVHEANFGTEELLPVSAQRVLPITGPAIDLLVGGRSWIGPIRQNVPLSLTALGSASSSVVANATTTRGPIGPGTVRTTHPAREPLVAQMIIAPAGERFKTLRLSTPKIGSGRLRVALYTTRERSPFGGLPTLERLVMDERRAQIELTWTGKSCQLLSDTEQLVRSCRLDDGDVLLSFSERFTGDAILLTITPLAALLSVTSVRRRRALSDRLRAIARRLPRPIKQLLLPAYRAYRRRQKRR